MHFFAKKVLQFQKKSDKSMFILNGGVAQLVRAPACHAGGRGFEPLHSRHSFHKTLSLWNFFCPFFWHFFLPVTVARHQFQHLLIYGYCLVSQCFIALRRKTVPQTVFPCSVIKTFRHTYILRFYYHSSRTDLSDILTFCPIGFFE